MKELNPEEKTTQPIDQTVRNLEDAIDLQTRTLNRLYLKLKHNQGTDFWLKAHIIIHFLATMS